MGRVLRVLLVTLLAVAGCSRASEPQPAESFVPNDQQNTLGRLAISGAGYEPAGIPVYNGVQWTINVRVAGCKANVTLAGNPGPESQSPTSFTVYNVGGVLFADLNTGLDGKNVKAADLAAVTGMRDRLDC